MPLRHRWTAGVLAALALTTLLQGCGSASEDDKVRDVVTGFFADVANSKGEPACARLTQAAIQQLDAAAFLLQAPASCPEAIATFSRQLSGDDKKALKTAEVHRVTRTGDTATVADADISLKISGQSSLFRNNDPAPITLRKVSGSWKIDSLG